jgi:hypothetical protein
MPDKDAGISVGPWRASGARSLIMACVLLLHLGLLLILLRPVSPLLFRRNPSDADHLLRVELLPRSKRNSVAAVASPRPMPLPAHAAPTHPNKVAPSVATTSVVATPTALQPEPIQPPAPPAAPYGNSRFAHALNDAQSTGLPQLPGANEVSTVPGIMVAPPPSLKSQLQALTRWHNCKNAIFKRRMSDQALLQRGLTERQMNQAFQANCMP